MSDTQFGDWTPEDSYSPDSVPDPVYVTRRLHEARAFFAAMGGEQVAAWDDLTPDEKDVASALGEELTNHLIAKGRDGSALALHEARRFLGEQTEWKDLAADAQAIALALGDYIVQWLQTEGTVIR